MIGPKKELIFLMLLILVPLTTAVDFDHVVTNTDNWKDVYSGLHYANLNNVESDFLTSTNHGPLLINSLSKSKSIMVLSSKEGPYVFNYPNLMESEGFSDVDEISMKNFNLELIEELEDIENFVIVDTEYGYSGIAVAPYAVQKNAWVFFADKVNINQIDNILSERNTKEVLIYGYVDREVRDTLEKYSPRIINHDDKFEDNIQITEEFIEMNPTTQVLLTNGEFIENELMLGNQPVLFTGRENVPDQIRDYIKSSPLEIGVLIGNELMGAATNIRGSTGISVMVKFARGARAPDEGVSAVEGLDLFPLPTPLIELEIYSIEYNKISQQLEITYKSSSNIPVYFKGTVTFEADGDALKGGDLEPIYIAPGAYKTVSYPFEVNDYNSLKAEIYTLYGESKSSLDRVLDAEYDVKVVEVVDRCELEINSVTYNKQKDQFEIKVKNVGPVNCWAEATIEDLLIGYETETISTTDPYLMGKRKTKTLYIEEELTNEDIEKNRYIDVVTYYGEKETSLIKIISGTFEIKTSTLTTITYLIILLLILLSVGIIFFVREKKKEKGFQF